MALTGDITGKRWFLKNKIKNLICLLQSVRTKFIKRSIKCFSSGWRVVHSTGSHTEIRAFQLFISNVLLKINREKKEMITHTMLTDDSNLLNMFAWGVFYGTDSSSLNSQIIFGKQRGENESKQRQHTLVTQMMVLRGVRIQSEERKSPYKKLFQRLSGAWRQQPRKETKRCICFP